MRACVCVFDFSVEPKLGKKKKKKFLSFQSIPFLFTAVSLSLRFFWKKKKKKIIIFCCCCLIVLVGCYRLGPRWQLAAETGREIGHLVTSFLLPDDSLVVCIVSCLAHCVRVTVSSSCSEVVDVLGGLFTVNHIYIYPFVSEAVRRGCAGGPNRCPPRSGRDLSGRRNK